MTILTMRGIPVADGMSIHLETREVNEMINKLLNKVERPKPLLKKVQRFIHYLTMKMFRGVRPDTRGVRGVKWPKLAKSTIKAKKAKVASGKAIASHRPMVETGYLRDSIKVLGQTDKGFLYGSRAKSKGGFSYGGHHNKGRFPWLFLRKDDFLQIQQMTVDYLTDKKQAEWTDIVKPVNKE